MQKKGEVQYTEAKTARTRHSQILTHNTTSALTDTDAYTRTNRLTNAETRAQLTRREIVETSMSWAGSDTGRHRAAIAEEGESAYLCLWFQRWSVG